MPILTLSHCSKIKKRIPNFTVDSTESFDLKVLCFSYDGIMGAQLCQDLKSVCILTGGLPPSHPLYLWPISGYLCMLESRVHIFKFCLKMCWCVVPACPWLQSVRAWGRIIGVSSLQEQEFGVNPWKLPYNICLSVFHKTALSLGLVSKFLFCLSSHHPAKQAKASTPLEPMSLMPPWFCDLVSHFVLGVTSWR